MSGRTAWSWSAVLAMLVTSAGCLGEPSRPGPGSGSGSNQPPPDTWSSVTAGSLHTCGIRLDGTLWCWGRNDSGQLGTSPTDVEDDVPTQVGSAMWSSVSASANHTCAIDAANGLWCWGDNSNGQIGTGSDAASIFEPAALPDAWIAVAAGTSHTCGIHTDGTLWCWGDGVYGELGGGSALGSPVPTAIAGSGTPGGWSAVAAGDTFTCAIGDDASLWCWGNNEFGSLAANVANAVDVPVLGGSAGQSWKQLAAGGFTACGELADGTLQCWGYDQTGQLGDDNTAPSFTPVDVGADPATWSGVAVGLAHACGIHTDGSLYCWGNNAQDQLASITTEPFSASPVEVTFPGGTWLALAAGDAHTCAIDSNHAMWCAGLDSGALGAAGGGSRTSPVEVDISAVTVSIGGDLRTDTGGTACSLDASNALSCWGDNVHGAVGDGTTVNRQLPVAIDHVDAWQAVAVSGHTCAIDGGDDMFCWGDNGDQAVGNDAGADQLTPTQVGQGPEWAAVAVNRHTCALDGSGNPWCWGLNQDGQAGQVSPTFVATPTLVSSTTPWSAIAVGNAHTCGIMGAGLVCWGDATYGQDGPDGTGGSTPIAAGVAATGLAVGGNDTCAASDTGSGSAFACFGQDDHGQLGNQMATPQGDATPYALPFVWNQLSVGENHTCGIQTDGTLWCWGDNAFGELGLGSFVEFHEPQMVGSGADWVVVAAGVDDTCAVTTQDDLYCWGRNLEGEVGDGAAWRAALTMVQ